MYKHDLEKLLQEGYVVELKPQGYSMYPLFTPGRDMARIEQIPIAMFRKGDVALYRRTQGILVLHRICKISEDGFYMVGDNQSEVEGPIHAAQLKGKLAGFTRKGHSYTVKHPLYRFQSALWLWMLPLRPLCFRISKFLHDLF